LRDPEGGRTLLVIPDKDASAIQRAILKLYHDHEIGRKMGECSRAYVKRRFSREIFGERLFEIYKKFWLKVKLDIMEGVHLYLSRLFSLFRFWRRARFFFHFARNGDTLMKIYVQY
jgi:hypothetical protein